MWGHAPTRWPSEVCPAGAGGQKHQAIPYPPQDGQGLRPIFWVVSTHHGFRESAEFHVVGSENGLLVALDEGRVPSDQPQPVLQARIGT